MCIFLGPSFEDYNSIEQEGGKVPVEKTLQVRTAGPMFLMAVSFPVVLSMTRKIKASFLEEVAHGWDLRDIGLEKPSPLFEVDWYVH